MVVDGETKDYTAPKNMSRLRMPLGATGKGAYHFFMNCLNGFKTASARNKHYEYRSRNGHVKVKMPTKKKSC